MTSTPTDEAKPQPAKKKVPARGTRKRVLGEGEGDYLIMQVHPGGDGIPAKAMLPIPDTPQFENTNVAMKWIRQEGAEILAGKQLAIIAVKELLNIEVQQKPTVRIATKAKITVNDPTAKK